MRRLNSVLISILLLVFPAEARRRAVGHPSSPLPTDTVIVHLEGLKNFQGKAGSQTMSLSRIPLVPGSDYDSFEKKPGGHWVHREKFTVPPEFAGMYRVEWLHPFGEEFYDHDPSPDGNRLAWPSGYGEYKNEIALANGTKSRVSSGPVGVGIVSKSQTGPLLQAVVSGDKKTIDVYGASSTPPVAVLVYTKLHPGLDGVLLHYKVVDVVRGRITVPEGKAGYDVHLGTCWGYPDDVCSTEPLPSLKVPETSEAGMVAEEDVFLQGPGSVGFFRPEAEDPQ